jgi:ubiquinone/menaquinone biosynthesis C-methylase UbiE
MKRTDYDGVAARYEQSPWRRRVAPDPLLGARLDAAGERAVTVLDVGCGTGNYLARQIASFQGKNVRWLGVDPSPGMLRYAREKAPSAELAVGRAESLPFADGSVDYVVSTFAFHHFEDKPKALGELCRVLAPGGALRLVNIDPFRMEAFWIYTFFPESRREDDKRFWPVSLLTYELEQRGLSVRARVEVDLYRAPLAGLLVEAELREMSQLVILGEREYQAGLDRLRGELARHPDGAIATELAISTLWAERAREAG